MKNILITSNQLDKLVASLDGKIPYMSLKEKRKYENYTKELEDDYNIFLSNIKKCQSKELQNNLLKAFNDYTECSNCRNGLLNDSYYKEGIRDGICLFLECIKYD